MAEKAVDKPIRIQLPIFDDLARELRSTGVSERNLNAQQLAQIMNGVIGGLLAGQDAVKAQIPEMNVGIANSVGTVKGRVKASFLGFNADIGIDCSLQNGAKPNEISLRSLKVDTSKSGFTTRMALGSLNLEGRARDILKDPNAALVEAINTQLEGQDVQIASASFKFIEEELQVRFQGTHSHTGTTTVAGAV